VKGVIYARYSSDNQTENSIEGQLRDGLSPYKDNEQKGQKLAEKPPNRSHVLGP